MRKSDRVRALSLAGGALGALAALMLAAPTAYAEPELPVPAPPLPGPLPGPQQPIAVQAAPADPALPVAPGDPALPAADPTLVAAPPAEVPHLASPDNLPPGTSAVPVDPPQGRGTSYLRDLFHAYQTQEIDGKGALLLLTQRPLDANAMPTNGMPTGPQAPPGAPLPEGAPLPQGSAPLAEGPAPVAPAPDAPPADAPPPPAFPWLPPPAPAPAP